MWVLLILIVGSGSAGNMPAITSISGYSTINECEAARDMINLSFNPNIKGDWIRYEAHCIPGPNAK